MSNPTSTIILYKNSKIIPSRNMILDSLADYLSSLTKITIANFQYQRHHLEMEIKIDKTQTWQEFDDTYNYDYLSIQNSDSNRVVYYFILEKRQVANSTIALKLRMDTANTFQWNVDYIPSNRTKVIREHKDRFSFRLNSVSFRDGGIGIITKLITLTSGDTFDGKLVLEIDGIQEEFEATLKYRFILPSMNYYDFYFNNIEEQVRLYKLNETNTIQVINFYDENNPTGVVEGNSLYFSDNYKIDISKKRIIDYYSEGLTPILYKTELGQLIHNENSTWNLVYRNDVNSAIACFCIPSNEGLKVDVPANETLTYTDFEDGVYYDIAPFVNNGNTQVAELTDNNGKVYYINKNKMPKQIRRTGTTLQIRITDKFTIYAWHTITSISFNVDKLYYYKTSESSINVIYTGSILDESFIASNGSFSASSSTQYDLDSLDDVDRVDPELIKIIEIPYFPSAYVNNSGVLSVDTTWTYSTSQYNALQLNDLNTQFSSYIQTSVDNPLNVFDVNYTPSLNDVRDNERESKLFHSDYYRPVFVYDSFAFNFDLEKIDVENFTGSSNFNFEFVMTSTINSKFLFKFPEYVLKMSTENYDNVLTIARNNESPIYNSAYITYLRTAYRYDLKALNYRGIEKATNVSADALNLGIDAGLVGATGGSGFIGLARRFISYTSNVINTALSTSKEWDSLDAKIEALKKQTNSVSGSDDIDLLNSYSGNRAKLVLYKLCDRDYQLLADLFYYYGYTTNEIKIPSLNTRNWFNFVSCELELKGTGDNIPNDLIDDIKQRFNTGITIFHKVNGTWDLDQEKENWEVSII